MAAMGLVATLRAMMTSDALAREQRLLMRIASACAILGPLVLAASFVPHGDLPTNESSLLGEEVALRYVADHPSWLIIHLATIVAGILWIGAFAGLAGTLTPGAAGALGRLLVPSAVVGGTFVIFDYGVDGLAFGILADEWAAASGPDQLALQRMAETGIWLLNGTFRSEIVIFYGLTVLIAGLAVVFDGRYPVWFGTTGALAGGAVLVNGLLSYAGVRVLQEDLLLFVVTLPVECVWLLTLGVLMWRRA
jgi:hypothetical protein